MSYSKKQIEAAAKDMNKVMGLEPAIDINLDDEELLERIKEEADEVLANDNLKPATWKMLEQLGVAEDVIKERNSNDDDDDDDNKKEGDNMSTKKKKVAKKKTVVKKTAKKKVSDKKEPAKKAKKIGVIVSIIEFLEKPLTREQIVEKLTKRFPDRSPESLAGTVRVQVPGRLNKEHGFSVEKDSKDRYVIA